MPLFRISPRRKKTKNAMVVMGQDTPHPANAFYAAMDYNLQLREPNIIIGTVEGSQTIDDVKKMLLAKNIKKAYLMPFMSVAGDHAGNDMAGDEDASWKSIIERLSTNDFKQIKENSHKFNRHPYMFTWNFSVYSHYCIIRIRLY
jgi:sirohydrochlorin cobaltochelatase